LASWVAIRRLAHLDEIAATRAKGRNGVGRCQIADEAHPRRIHALAAEHGQHRLVRRRRSGEGDHRAAHDVRPREPRRLTADQKEPVAAVDLGEVRQESAAAVGDVETAHEPAQADLGAALDERARRARAAGARSGGDVEALRLEVAQVERDVVRRVEHGVEGLHHGDLHGARV